MGRQRRSFGRLRKLPSGRYQASYQGPDLRVYTAPSTFAAKIDAEAWLTDRRREIDRELWSPPATEGQQKAAKAAKVTFGDYAETWLANRMVKGKPIKPRTREHYRKLLDQQILPAFKTAAVRDISQEDVDTWYAKTAVDTPVTRAHAYSLLRTILETARTREPRLIEVNPCSIGGAGSSERRIKPKPVTLDQLAVLIENMPDRLQAMILLACWTSLRFGELVELQRQDIDTDEGVVMVRRAAVRANGGWVIGDPKSEAGRRDVAIPPNIIPAIVAHLANHVGKNKSALLFPPATAKGAGDRLQPSTVYRHFYRARAAANRPDLRFHDLRHSGAVMAAQSGATLAELMARLGHRTHTAALRYQHQAQGRDKTIAGKMALLAQGDTPTAK